MPNDQQRALNDLKRCMRDANGDQRLMDACEATFKAVQGTTTEGGKVFSISDGNAAFVTHGGKVFGGKVF
jgi:hypothetical protein